MGGVQNEGYRMSKTPSKNDVLGVVVGGRPAPRLQVITSYENAFILSSRFTYMYGYSAPRILLLVL